MRVICSIELGYETPEVAERVYSSVSPDDAGYVESRVEGNTIISGITAKSLDSLMHTLDDYLACIQVAEKVAIDR